jgi:hypothetical protein
MGLTYPLTEGDDATSSALYEKYIKNRIDNDIVYGHTVDVITNSSYRKDDAYNSEVWTTDENMPNTYFGRFRYVIKARDSKGVNIPSPSIDLHFRMPENVVRYYVKLNDNTANTYVEYDSNETYVSPNEFQQVCKAKETTSNYELTAGHVYYLSFDVWIDSIPQSKTYDVSGYLYPSVNKWRYNDYNELNIRGDFYYEDGLGYGEYSMAQSFSGLYYSGIVFDKILNGPKIVFWGGYCRDGVAVEPIKRVIGQKCLNKSINVITGEPFNTVFKCVDDGKRAMDVYEVAYMDVREWIDSCFYMSLKLWSANS